MNNRTAELYWVIGLSLLSALLVKLPELFPGIGEDDFLIRNAPLIVLNGIILYTLRLHHNLSMRKLIPYGLVVLAVTLFINLLPYGKSDSILIASAHIPLLFWCIFGLAFVSFDHRNPENRMAYIRFNGELAIMTGLILLAGAVLSAVTISLFSTIKLDITEFYVRYIAMSGAVASPIVAFFLIRLYPDITRRVSPVIARIFTPVVLVTLAVFLIAMLFSPLQIRTNREFLLAFNAMLLAVVALIVFSISELDRDKKKDKNVLVLFLLALLTILINSIALAAIISRLADGFTPNRSVVLITNILVFINLILVAVNLFRCYFRDARLDTVESSVSNYLTVYAVWTVIAIFAVPLVFGFR